MSEWTDEQVREMAARRAAWEYAAMRAATPALVPTPVVVSMEAALPDGWDAVVAMQAAQGGVINNRRRDEMGDYNNLAMCQQAQGVSGAGKPQPRTVGEVLDERVRHHQGEAERLGTLRVRLKDVLSMDVSALGELLSRVY